MINIIFSCGHPYSSANIDGLKHKRCKTCRIAGDQRRRDARAAARRDREQEAAEGRASKRGSKLVTEPAVLGSDPSTETMPRGSRALLTALYRAHPYVFDAAERQGRQCVRP